MDVIRPDWPAPARVRALMTTRQLGDLSSAQARARLRQLLPEDPAWLRQVHGVTVVDASQARSRPQADAAFSRTQNAVCAVMAADCMPVLLCDEAGGVVAAAHAGWRGLCGGVIESAVAAMRAPSGGVLAWLGPAIGPAAYEVGEEVRQAFLAKDPLAQGAFAPARRPGHWMLDLYAIARQRLAASGVTRVYGGGFCTHAQAERFFSFRRDGTSERMAALIWLT
jgi:YfiH family protein